MNGYDSKITIHERIIFDSVTGEAKSWEQSMDGGETWKTVQWCGERLPFILIQKTDEFVWIEQKRELPVRVEFGAPQ